MKKAMATVLAAVMICGVCATGVLAAGHHGSGAGFSTARVCSRNDGVCGGHTCRSDADGDGVCDLCGSAVTCWGDTDGDGVCDSCGAACGTGGSVHRNYGGCHGTGRGRCGR